MEYYKALYTSATHPENSNDTASAFFENITSLENMDKQMCEGKISAEECLMISKTENRPEQMDYQQSFLNSFLERIAS